MGVELMQGDCLELMQAMPDKSVDLVLTDPPYNIGKAKWDKIPNYIEWCGKWLKEVERVLKGNGSFYFWHNDMPQIAQLMEWIRVNTGFVFKQLITWNKTNFKRFAWNNRNPQVCRDRNWFPNIEYCLFYTFQDETGLEQILPACFAPYLDYMTSEKNAAGMSVKSVNALTGYVSIASHWFWQEPQKRQPQPRFIGESDYRKLQSTGRWQRPYEALRQEYEALRQEYEGQRYTFDLAQAGKNISCIWESGASNSGAEHACKKPIDLLERIVKTSSNPGDTVLDCFMGSGSTGVACVNTNRNFIGIELDADYFKIAEKRIADAQNKPEQISLIANK